MALKHLGGQSSGLHSRFYFSFCLWVQSCHHCSATVASGILWHSSSACFSFRVQELNSFPVPPALFRGADVTEWRFPGNKQDCALGFRCTPLTPPEGAVIIPITLDRQTEAGEGRSLARSIHPGLAVCAHTHCMLPDVLKASPACPS